MKERISFAVELSEQKTETKSAAGRIKKREGKKKVRTLTTAVRKTKETGGFQV